jgi:hypothetical protein
MIVFDLQCLDGGELFEAWFGSNADFDAQVEQGLVRCPVCQSCRVAKAPMAPLVPRKGASDGGAAEAIARLACAQAEMLRKSEWVGDRFAETARAMHLGELPESAVHGEATRDEAKALVEDGVSIAPLPLPVIPPNQVN